jgi:hypothetical protein
MVEGAVFVHLARTTIPVYALNRITWLAGAMLVGAGVACSDAVAGPPRFTLSGTVEDSVTGRLLPGANVSANGETAVVDSEGEFLIPVDSGAVELRIEHLDFARHTGQFRWTKARF